MIQEIRNNRLYFDGCDTPALAGAFGTPLYVYSQTAMEERCRELRDCFLTPYPKNRAAYAAKAFCTAAMMKLVEKEGLCVDVVSGGELYTAMKAEFPAERIEFNGNNKSREELELAVEYGIGRIIVDGLGELELIEQICEEKGRRARVLYRITPGVKSDSHDYIVTGKKDSKFGIPLDDDVILPYVKRALDSNWVDFLGFHFHVGSQLFDNTSHLQALEIMLELVRKVRDEYSYTAEELNLGGGFGIRYTEEERKPYAYFLEPMMKRITEVYAELGAPMPAVVAEPGRSIVGEAGMTLYTVGSKKEIRDVRTYVAVDGGMTDNIRPALYQAEYKGIVANRAEEAADEIVTVCGKCCESGDILMRDTALAHPEPGDILAVLSTGAYGYSMASNYNRNRIPGVIFVKDGEAGWAVTPQSFEDMTANDAVPVSLQRVCREESGAKLC